MRTDKKKLENILIADEIFTSVRTSLFATFGLRQDAYMMLKDLAETGMTLDAMRAVRPVDEENWGFINDEIKRKAHTTISKNFVGKDKKYVEEVE